MSKCRKYDILSVSLRAWCPRIRNKPMNKKNNKTVTARKKYTVTDKVRRQRRAASKCAAAKRVRKSNDKNYGWRSVGITLDNKQWCILQFGSVNEAINDLRSRVEKSAKKGVR